MRFLRDDMSSGEKYEGQLALRREPEKRRRLSETAGEREVQLQKKGLLIVSEELRKRLSENDHV